MPRARNSRWIWQRATAARNETTMNAESVSPSCSTLSAACRSAGSARTDGIPRRFLHRPIYLSRHALLSLFEVDAICRRLALTTFRWATPALAWREAHFGNQPASLNDKSAWRQSGEGTKTRREAGDQKASPSLLSPASSHAGLDRL